MPYSLEHQRYPYLLYDLDVRYHWGSGKLALPVAYQTGGNPAKHTEIPRVSAEQGTKVVAFHLVRLGKPPVLPSPEPASANETLLSATVVPKPVNLDAQGNQKKYEVSGQYVFALARPVFVDEAHWPTTPVVATEGASPALEGKAIIG